MYEDLTLATSPCRLRLCLDVENIPRPTVGRNGDLKRADESKASKEGKDYRYLLTVGGCDNQICSWGVPFRDSDLKDLR